MIVDDHHPDHSASPTGSWPARSSPGPARGCVRRAGLADWPDPAADGRFPLPPHAAPLGGLAVAVAAGAVAGLYPAVRAARLSPVDALRPGG
ncbi:hypothetical protein [Spongiactinospora sp. TRM90649]|uniref:hypothetical protein n=1 Tax=Spongiactinospora sp. TRM90649 TaxID=3031114 RepID=UPI0023F7E9A8|nr:hypothetical protein [Spongiactinospora sp. TRM90649]MDF5754989.1 hypothetical protein [Spongiactinospora sp. TRM90649]